MKKILLLSIILIVFIAGCAQQPTGQILANETVGTECVANWTCEDFWSSCERTGADTGIQNRTCIDNNNCDASNNKRQESRVCGLPRITLKEPQQMALESSDLPSDRNWTLMEKNVLSGEEVTPTERILGFKKGYYVHYFSQYKVNDNLESMNIYHKISVYPLADSAINMTFSFDTAEENYKVGSFYESTNKKILSISQLSDPVIGDLSLGYNITFSDNAGLKGSIYTICFTKWDVADVVTIEGTKIDYEFLKELARKAEGKIA
jgi:hypothetical protein